MDLNDFTESINNARNFNSHNGLKVTELREEYCVVEAPVTIDSLNPQQVAHGSFVFALMDLATGMASASTGRNMLTLDATVHYLRPGRGKALRAEAEMIKSGRTTGLYESRVYDDEGRLCAKGEFTVYYTGGEIDLAERRRRDAALIEQMEQG